MIELANANPPVDVDPAEYKRLLGYPRERALSARARELVRHASAWYAAHARPWTYSRQAGRLEIVNGSVVIDGTPLYSRRLQTTLAQAGADSAVLVAVSAGAEIEQEANRAWQEGKPDEYFFLEVFGSAVVEHLTTRAGAELCAWAEGEGLAVLPHVSPGYTGWDMADQPRLLELIPRSGGRALPGQLATLDSGMLRPKKSLLAVFGLTRHTDRVAGLRELNPCQSCAFHPCQYRRAPYARTAAPLGPAELSTTESLAAAVPLDRAGNYAVNPKALRRWAAERLRLNSHNDGSIDAEFRYDGTTCTNLGRPLEFRYRVTLGPPEEGYPLRAQECRPSNGDEGHTLMCGYLENGEQLMREIDREQPLLGRPLNDVLSWRPRTGTAGCYCTGEDRLHKWRMVLETIHFALAQQHPEQTKLLPIGMTNDE